MGLAKQTRVPKPSEVCMQVLAKLCEVMMHGGALAPSLCAHVTVRLACHVATPAAKTAEHQ